MGLPPDEVILGPPGTLTKTSSGKLRRNATKKDYISGKLLRHQLPTLIQVSKLSILSFAKKIKQKIHRFFRFIYSVYFLSMYIIVLIPFWLGIKLTPRKIASVLFKIQNRISFFLSGFPPKVTGRKNLDASKPVIYVCNHQSFLDSLLLVSILPRDVLFLGKRELLDNFLIRGVIEKLGYLSVDRLDFTSSIEDMSQVKTALEQGRSVAIFPEGTFSYAKGLLPFRLGAFKLAVETNTEICPVAIQGTRHFLRAATMLFNPRRLKVWIGKRLKPKSKQFSEAIRLRNEAKELISDHSGEKTLNLVRAVPPNHE